MKKVTKLKVAEINKTNEWQEGVVEVLEEALARAKSGELKSVLVVGITRADTPMQGFSPIHADFGVGNYVLLGVLQTSLAYLSNLIHSYYESSEILES